MTKSSSPLSPGRGASSSPRRGRRRLLGAMALALALTLALAVVTSTRAPAPSAGAFPGDAGAGRGRDSGGSLVAPAPEAGEDAAAAPRAEPRSAVAPAEEARAALGLRVVNRATGEPAASRVELWQLDGAEPKRRARLDVPVEGARVEDLAPGTYRAFVVARLRASEDPPAFRVAAPLTEVELAVDLPRLQRVWLAVYDERGTALRLGRLAGGYASQPDLPSPFGAAGAAGEADAAGGFDFGSRSVSVGPEGYFDLGQVRDLDCDRSGAPWYTLTPKERTPVSVELPGHELFSRDEYEPEEASLYLLGVSLPADWFDDAIRTPDGGRASDAGAQIRVRCEPRSSTEAPAADAWSRLPVQVEVELEGHQPLRFTYRLEEGPPGRRELRPGPR